MKSADVKTPETHSLPVGPASADERGQPSACHLVTLSAWCYLVWLCLQRQARVHQMVWIALALLGVMATVVAMISASAGWGMGSRHWRWVEPPFAPAPFRGPSSLPVQSTYAPWPPHEVRLTYQETVWGMEIMAKLVPWSPSATMIQEGISHASQLALKRSDFYVYSNWVVFLIFVGFLLPIWSLSFATEALGGEREGRTLVWLLSRPLSRPAIYLAKFVALLPWSLGLTLGGFGLLCALAGRPGGLAFRLYWPGIIGGTVAFCALFHLLGACFRRASVIALVYSFFLETLLGDMPGYMKRISISFYTRCLMFEAAQDYGVQPEKPSIYLPVDGTSAWLVLLGVTATLLVAGMIVFTRLEYQDLS